MDFNHNPPTKQELAFFLAVFVEFPLLFFLIPSVIAAQWLFLSETV